MPRESVRNSHFIAKANDVWLKIGIDEQMNFFISSNFELHFLEIMNYREDFVAELSGCLRSRSDNWYKILPKKLPDGDTN